MKLGTAILLAVLGGCAVARKAGPEASAIDVRGSADDLRVVHEYRPAPTGSEALAVSYDHPPRTYYADCWRRKACYPAYRWNPPCERSRYYRRCD